MGFGVGDLVVTIGSGPGYVTASRKKFDRNTKYQYGYGTQYVPPIYVRIDMGTLALVLTEGEKLISDTIVQYEILLPDGERVWIWSNSLRSP
jgi:hypothetical protein